MNVIPVVFPCATGDEPRYWARVVTPLIQVSVFGVSRMDAITRCLSEFNNRTYYDQSFNGELRGV